MAVFQPFQHHINGVDFSAYPCKYLNTCPKASNNLTITVTLNIKNHPERSRQIEKACPCTHGGGVSCKGWRYYTNRGIGWYREFGGRTAQVGNVKAGMTVTLSGLAMQSQVLDNQDAVLKRLKNMKLEPL